MIRTGRLLSKLRAYYWLPWRSKRVYAEAVFELLRARHLVKSKPYQTWSKYLDVEAAKEPAPAPDRLQDAELVCRSINGVSHQLGASYTCLIKVVAARRMLRRRRIASAVEIGVNWSKERCVEDFRAHAWLDIDNRTMVGREEKAEYQAITKR